MKVLVVDDVGYIRHHVSRMLQSLGHVPVVADSARHAVQTLERDPSIEVVLTDLLMAEFDGLWLFKASQKISRVTDAGDDNPPAFILMTAMRGGSGTQDRDMQKLQLAEQMGFIEVLSKPFDAKRLKQVLDKVQHTSTPLPGAVELLGRLERLQECIRQVIEKRDEELNLAAVDVVGDALDELITLNQSTPALV